MKGKIPLAIYVFSSNAQLLCSRYSLVIFPVGKHWLWDHRRTRSFPVSRLSFSYLCLTRNKNRNISVRSSRSSFASVFRHRILSITTEHPVCSLVAMQETGSSIHLPFLRSIAPLGRIAMLTATIFKRGAFAAVKTVGRRPVRWRRTDRRRASYRRQSRGRRRRRHVGSEFESAAIGSALLFRRVSVIVCIIASSFVPRGTSIAWFLLLRRGHSASEKETIR